MDAVTKMWAKILLKDFENASVFELPLPKPTLWERIRYPFVRCFRRIRDAWLVLVGKAEISEW